MLATPYTPPPPTDATTTDVRFGTPRLRYSISVGDYVVIGRSDASDTPKTYARPQSDPNWWRDAVVFLERVASVPEASADCEEPPSKSAHEYARRIGELLFAANMPPVRIAPSIDGGIVFSFNNAQRFGSVECYNSGEIVFVVSRGDGSPVVWECAVDDRSVAEALGTLHALLWL
jgi:hypothetical protein